MTQRFVAFAMLAAAAMPVTAQPAPPPAPPGAALSALEEMARAMREALQSLREDVTPWTGPLARFLAEPHNYEPPEVNAQGDILIRRRRDAPPLDREAPGLDL